MQESFSLELAAATPEAWQPPADWCGRMMRAGPVRLNVVEKGATDGPLTVLLHGTPLWSYYYRAVVEAQPNRRLVLIDLPGMGLSRAPVVPGRAFETAADALSLAFADLDEPFDLVTHATATPAALIAACRKPEQLRRLVISNAFGWSLLGGGKMEAMARIVSSIPFRWAVVHLNFLAAVTARKGRWTGPFDAEEREALLGPYRDFDTRRHLANYLLSLRTQAPLFEQLERDLPIQLGHVETLLLYGAHDNGYQAGFADRWARLLPRSELVLLGESAHFPFEDEPQAAVDALLSFLQDGP